MGPVVILRGKLMKRPYPVAGMFVATLVLWAVSVGCAFLVAFTVGINPNAGLTGQPSPLVVFGAVAALGAGIFAIWTGWRACRALDYLVRTVR